LARHYRSLGRWRREMEAAQDPESPARADLLDVHGIGEDMAADIIGFFAEPHNQAVLDDLAGEVTVLDYAAPARRASSPLAGKTIVFTGGLEAMSRSEAKARAEALGANVASSVSAKTDYVVIGADAGSKATKAAALGVTTLDEAAWLELAGVGAAAG
jgi:DNA ligase (NAD+)